MQPMRRMQAYGLLAAFAAAALVVSVAAVHEKKAVWTEIPYPVGDAKHYVGASPMVHVDAIGEAGHIGYHTIYRDNVVPAAFAGEYTVNAANLVNDQYFVDGVSQSQKFVYEQSSSGQRTSTIQTSNNPDFTSILRVEDKIFSITHYESPTPGVAYLTELSQDKDSGKLTFVRSKPLDFTADKGLWTPCAGSVTPWETHLGSEEYEPDAKCFADDTCSWNSWPMNKVRPFLRYFGTYTGSSGFGKDIALNAGFRPYRYGYPWETKVNADFSETTTKLYTHGRQSYEMSYAMPDRQTVYNTDDGTNVFFAMFKATAVNDITEGYNYCAKYTQTSPAGGDAKDWTADIEWIKMPWISAAEVEAAIETSTFYDLFEYQACSSTGSVCPSGFSSVNTWVGCECLKVKPGMDALASVFEKRRYAGMQGCTTEFRKWEGITFDEKRNKLYTAISEVEYGMEDNMKNGSPNTKYDLGTPNHLKISDNQCGCVMEMDVNEDMTATKARMLTCGVPNPVDRSDADIIRMTASFGGTQKCIVDHIANPDNVAMIQEYDQLIIGEDTGAHDNNLIWIYDLETHEMTRVASTPLGAETTSPYWYTVGDWNYMSYIVQHPGSDITGTAGYIGYVGPIPRKPDMDWHRPAAVFQPLTYPEGGEIHDVRTSAVVKITHDDIGDARIGYKTLYRSSEMRDGVIAGRIVDKDGNPIKDYTSDNNGRGMNDVISNNPDMHTIMRRHGKIFSVVHFESPRPGVAYLAQYEQEADGTLKTVRLKPLDFSAHGGVWVPCAGSLTPWETHIGSEEYEPDARRFYSGNPIGGSERTFLRYFGTYVAEANWQVAQNAGFYVYRYGYPWETVVNADFSETTTKLYAHGRQSYEMPYAMPDRKTVYNTDDGTNVFFAKFIADKEGDITEGQNYCAKYTQTSPAGSEAIDWTADIEWIAMPKATHSQIEAAIETTTFDMLFDVAECVDYTSGSSCPSGQTSTNGVCCPFGYTAVNGGGRYCECLRTKTGMQALAAHFEKRRYAGLLGCTTEFRKWEGITYDPKNKKLYTAISSVEYGMEDYQKNGNSEPKYDRGTGNHLKMKQNDCGCVMEMDVDDSDGTLSATKARMLTCGMHDTDPSVPDFCYRNHIANPDNVAMINDYEQLIIGEDTGKHSNNLMWIWDIPTKAMTRIAQTPVGAETTGPYWYSIGDWSYMSFIVQHPRSDVTGHDGYVGYVGPFPRSSLVVHKDEPEECHACHEVATLNHMIADLGKDLEARCPAAGNRRALCAGFEETTAAPSPLTSYSHFVKFSISLPMSKADFTADKKSAFRSAVAAAADVAVQDVVIDKVTAVGSGRRKLANDIRVDTSVKAKDEDSAKAMAQTLTEVAINEELQNKGVLNKDEEAKMILEAVAVAKPVVQDEDEEEEPASEATSNTEAIAIGVASGLGVLFVGALVAFVFAQARRPQAPTKSADLAQMPAGMPAMQVPLQYAPNGQMQFQHQVA